MRTAPEFNWPAPSETRTTDSTITTADNGKVIDNKGATTTITHTADDDLPEGFEISFINLSPVLLYNTAAQFWPPVPVSGEHQIIFSPIETDIILSSGAPLESIPLGIGQSVTILETHHSIVKFKLIYQIDVNDIMCNAWSCSVTLGERLSAHYEGIITGGAIPTTTQLQLKDLDPIFGITGVSWIDWPAQLGSTYFQFNIVQENTPDAIVGSENSLGVYTDGAVLAGPTSPTEKVYLEIQNNDFSSHFYWPSQAPDPLFPEIIILFVPIETTSDIMSNIISNSTHIQITVDENSQIIVEAATTNTYWIDNAGNLYPRSIADGPVTSFEISVLNGYGIAVEQPSAPAALWDFSQITTDLWWDFADISRIIFEYYYTNEIYSIVDKSSKYNDGTQPNTSYQPMWTYAAHNGLDCARFASSSSSHAEWLNFDTALSNIQTVFWVLLDSQLLGSGANRGMLGDSTVWDFHSGVNNNQIYSSTYTSAYIQNGTTNLNGTTINGTSTARPTSLSVISVVTTSGVTASNFSQDTGYIAASRNWQGDLGELVIVEAALSTADIQKGEGYLAWKWGLEGSLPISHPYKNLPPIVGGGGFPGY